MSYLWKSEKTIEYDSDVEIIFNPNIIEKNFTTSPAFIHSDPKIIGNNVSPKKNAIKKTIDPKTIKNFLVS